MTSMKTDYLSLVREEFLARGVKNGNSVSFVKVKIPITKENFENEFTKNIIVDEDLPNPPVGISWLPICEKSYPNICRTMTANQAGYYAIRKCKQQGWDFLQDWKCVLTNLEMDL